MSAQVATPQPWSSRSSHLTCAPPVIRLMVGECWMAPTAPQPRQRHASGAIDARHGQRHLAAVNTSATDEPPEGFILTHSPVLRNIAFAAFVLAILRIARRFFLL